jgi:transcriptional repressor of cell division inhibition gene dicB
VDKILCNDVYIAAVCGGVAQIAKHFNVTPWAVRKWFKSRIPAGRCKGLVELSNGQLKLKDLRPDLWD